MIVEIIETGIKGLLLIKPKVFQDARGAFLETFQEQRYKSHGITANFVQDNLSISQSGVLRGLHFQLQKPQDKLVSVLSGEVFDVAVDLRKDSPTFKKWFGCILNDQNRHQLFIPKGFAHGFYVLSPSALFHYKCSDYYNSADEAGIIWNDPELNIAWPITQVPNLSPKDCLYPVVSQLAQLPTV